jgi:glucose-6-phosphate 1-dehydrogenase
MAEIAFVFKPAPHSIFGALSTHLQPNALVIRLQPNEGVDIEIMTKEPGPGGLRLRQTWLDTSTLSDSQTKMPDAYERLLLDVVRGDQTLFMRGDEVEAAWNWVDPIIAAWKASGESPKNYTPHSQGPEESDVLMQNHGRQWRKIQ